MEKTPWMRFKAGEIFTWMYPIPNDSDLMTANEDLRKAAFIDAYRLRALSPEQYERALTDKSESIRVTAVHMARHDDISLTQEQLERALTEKKINVRLAAVRLALPVHKYWEDLPCNTPNTVVHKLTDAQRDRALMDSESAVRFSVVLTRGLTPGQLKLALLDDDKGVRRVASKIDQYLQADGVEVANQ